MKDFCNDTALLKLDGKIILCSSSSVTIRPHRSWYGLIHDTMQAPWSQRTNEHCMVREASSSVLSYILKDSFCVSSTKHCADSDIASNQVEMATFLVLGVKVTWQPTGIGWTREWLCDYMQHVQNSNQQWPAMAMSKLANINHIFLIYHTYYKYIYIYLFIYVSFFRSALRSDDWNVQVFHYSGQSTSWTRH